MKYIGVVGTRRRDTDTDMRLVGKAIRRAFELGDVIVSGGCKKGGDRFAEVTAKELGVKPRLFLPRKEDLDPVLLKKNARAAYAKINYARNTLIAERSDVLIACVAEDRKGGTEDTIKKFEKFHPGKKAILV